MNGLVESRKPCKEICGFLRKFLEEFMYFTFMFFMLVSSLKATVHMPVLGRKPFSGHHLIFL